MMDDLTRRRWDHDSKPESHNPRVALLAALAKFDEDERKPDHIIVAFGRHEEEGCDGTTYFQAGSYSHHGQQGLLMETMHMIRESGD